jgi:hypothetical protein
MEDMFAQEPIEAWLTAAPETRNLRLVVAFDLAKTLPGGWR